MKIQCLLLVVNRNVVLNGMNGRYLKSTLVIGNEPKTKDEHFIMHFSSSNKYGARYKVSSIKNVLTKFIHEGKATIQFQEPAHDLYIKDCEVMELKCFMKVLKSCKEGNSQEKQITNLANISVTAKDNAPVKLVITNHGQYPAKGLPRTLKSLSMTDLKLFNFPKEVMRLQRLTVLDLSNNNIRVLPEELGDMRLVELNLSYNFLGKHEENWKWVSRLQIRKTLKLLDVSHNFIRIVPKYIGHLTKLITLILEYNFIQELPSTIGRMSDLRYLLLSNNSVATLPGSMLRCPLKQLDISSNKLEYGPIFKTKLQELAQSHWNTFVGSLFNICSNTILRHDIEYQSRLPKRMIDLLDDMNVCLCRRPTMNDYCMKMCFFVSVYFDNVIMDHHTSGISAGGCKFDCYFCSYTCMRRYCS